MAEQFDSVTPDIGAADADNPQGTYLDEDAGIPGTPILAGWKNTVKAFMERLMIRTGKSYNGSPDESGAISQIYDALDEVTTGDDSLIADWAAATFDQDDVTRYGGKQWFVGVLSTIETPGPNSEWAKSKTFDKYLELATEKGPELGGFLPLNNIRDVTNYATYFRMGKFDWNGAKWEAWRVNIDGSAHVSATSDVAKLLALSKFESEVVASDSAGTLTLKDYAGRVARSVDAIAGDTQDIGDVQEDQGQGWQLGVDEDTTGAREYWGRSGGRDLEHTTQAQASNTVFKFTTTGQGQATKAIAKNDGTNGDIRQGEKTRDTSIAAGLWGIVCIVPEGTI